MYAHSLPQRSASEWELLRAHHARVARRAGMFAETFGFSALAATAGGMHDIGKCSAAFQTYISLPKEEAVSRGPNHSSAGAIEARRLFGAFGKILAAVIAGHHAGLADGPALEARLNGAPPSYEGWEAHAEIVGDTGALIPTKAPKASAEPGFGTAFLTRALFSCLVDADRLETAAFYREAEGLDADQGAATPLVELRDRLRRFMAAKAATAEAKAASPAERKLAALRAEILDRAVTRAPLPPGLFTLTVPTGGGKTLASLSFALEHAIAHDLKRIIYVIPFTSILEQSAYVFRKSLARDCEDVNIHDILEHHASFDWDKLSIAGSRGADEAGDGSSPAERLQRAAENWDVPIVVTTAVQFFESLFSNRPSACRKIHNIAGSVVILDEAQTLPLPILRPSLAALDELARNYGASIVLCTATQPAWRKQDEAFIAQRNTRGAVNFGLDIPPERELAPEPARLFTMLKRVEIEHRKEPVGDAEIAARFAAQPQMLCIVNSRRHAKALFDAIKHLPGAIHLSTWMCPRHRRAVLDGARAALAAGAPARIVSTSLIEAGVDIDLPEVWRAATGLESILQAAGRCNREFKLAAGRLVIFTPEADEGPHELRQAWEAGRATLRRHADPQAPEAIAHYFRELYFNKGAEAFDACRLDGKIWPIMPALAERRSELLFPFESIARAFKVIDDRTEPVIVPWKACPDDHEAETLLARIAAMDRPLKPDLRKLQLYTVTVPKPQRDAWLAQGALKSVHSALGETLLSFQDDTLYDARSGLRVLEPERRTAGDNVF